MDDMKRLYDWKKMTEGSDWTRFGNLIYIVHGSETEIFKGNSVLEPLE